MDTPLSGPGGNPAEGIPAMGFPCFSSGEPAFSELTLITALEPGIAYLEKTASTPDYKNPTITIVEPPPAEEAEESWAQLPEGERPLLSKIDQEKMKKELQMMRRWKRFQATGRVPDTDSESDADDDEVGGKLAVPAWPEQS